MARPHLDARVLRAAGDGTPASRPTGAVWAAASAAVAIHGLAHVTGFVLLWDLVDPANLTYAETSPDPGSLAGRAVGVGWLAAGGLFVAAAVLLYRRLARAWPVLLGASVLSLAVLLPSQDGVSVGITADLVAIVAVVKVFARRPGAAARPRK